MLFFFLFFSSLQACECANIAYRKSGGKRYPYPFSFFFQRFTGTKDWHKSTNSDAAYFASAASFSALRPILSSSSVLALNASNACTGFSLPFAAATCSAVCASVERQYLPYAYLLTPSALCLLAGIQRCLCVGGASVFVLLSKASKPSVQRVHRVLRIRQHTSAYVSIRQEGRLNRRCSVRIFTPVLLSKASKPSTLQL